MYPPVTSSSSPSPSPTASPPAEEALPKNIDSMMSSYFEHAVADITPLGHKDQVKFSMSHMAASPRREATKKEQKVKQTHVAPARDASVFDDMVKGLDLPETTSDPALSLDGSLDAPSQTPTTATTTTTGGDVKHEEGDGFGDDDFGDFEDAAVVEDNSFGFPDNDDFGEFETTTVPAVSGNASLTPVDSFASGSSKAASTSVPATATTSATNGDADGFGDDDFGFGDDDGDFGEFESVADNNGTSTDDWGEPTSAPTSLGMPTATTTTTSTASPSSFQPAFTSDFDDDFGDFEEASPEADEPSSSIGDEAVTAQTNGNAGKNSELNGVEIEDVSDGDEEKEEVEEVEEEEEEEEKPSGGIDLGEFAITPTFPIPSESKPSDDETAANDDDDDFGEFPEPELSPEEERRRAEEEKRKRLAVNFDDLVMGPVEDEQTEHLQPLPDLPEMPSAKPQKVDLSSLLGLSTGEEKERESDEANGFDDEDDGGDWGFQDGNTVNPVQSTGGDDSQEDWGAFSDEDDITTSPSTAAAASTSSSAPQKLSGPAAVASGAASPRPSVVEFKSQVGIPTAPEDRSDATAALAVLLAMERLEEAVFCAEHIESLSLAKKKKKEVAKLKKLILLHDDEEDDEEEEELTEKFVNAKKELKLMKESLMPPEVVEKWSDPTHNYISSYSIPVATDTPMKVLPDSYVDLRTCVEQTDPTAVAVFESKFDTDVSRTFSPSSSDLTSIQVALDLQRAAKLHVLTLLRLPVSASSGGVGVGVDVSSVSSSSSHRSASKKVGKEDHSHTHRKRTGVNIWLSVLARVHHELKHAASFTQRVSSLSIDCPSLADESAIGPLRTHIQTYFSGVCEKQRVCARIRSASQLLKINDERLISAFEKVDLAWASFVSTCNGDRAQTILSHLQVDTSSLMSAKSHSGEDAISEATSSDHCAMCKLKVSRRKTGKSSKKLKDSFIKYQNTLYHSTCLNVCLNDDGPSPSPLPLS